MHVFYLGRQAQQGRQLDFGYGDIAPQQVREPDQKEVLGSLVTDLPAGRDGSEQRANQRDQFSAVMAIMIRFSAQRRFLERSIGEPDSFRNVIE
jgi:hypothetical protein